MSDAICRLTASMISTARKHVTSANGMRSAAMIGGSNALRTAISAATSKAEPAPPRSTPGTISAAMRTAAAATTHPITRRSGRSFGATGCHLTGSRSVGMRLRHARWPPDAANHPIGMRYRGAPRPDHRGVDGGPFVTRFEAAFGLVLLCVVATYVFASLTAYHGVGGVFITALASITGVIALASANARSRYVALGRLLGVAAIVLAIVGSSADQRWAFGVAALLVTVLLAVGAFAVLGAVITEQKVGFRTILGA